MFLFLEKISCILIAGAFDSKNVEVLTGEFGTIRLPNLPFDVYSNPSIFVQNGTILLCGGNYTEKECQQLDIGTWKRHSTLNVGRVRHSAVTTKQATFLFGSSKTYEYLPKDSTTWLMGQTDIPGGFSDGCAIAVKSEQEICLIGGSKTQKRILSFNVNDQTFREWPSRLNFGRIGHRCAFIPNTNKILITGGFNGAIGINGAGDLDVTEILDIDN